MDCNAVGGLIFVGELGIPLDQPFFGGDSRVPTLLLTGFVYLLAPQHIFRYAKFKVHCIKTSAITMSYFASAKPNFPPLCLLRVQ